MNMKNADMPAMPQPMASDQDGCMYTTFDNYHGDQSGLTKREMFVMNADVKDIIKSMGDMDMILEFLGFEYSEIQEISSHLLSMNEKIKYRLQAEAKLSVMSADARLAELEK